MTEQEIKKMGEEFDAGIASFNNNITAINNCFQRIGEEHKKLTAIVNRELEKLEEKIEPLTIAIKNLQNLMDKYGAKNDS